MWSAGQGDNQERFLADLRALRDTAAIGFDELAARAHYPSNILKEAENGPGLPGLPILAAYVRACDADVPEWEERWRRLACEAETDPGLPVRAAGASPAAVAGARAGVSIAPPDAYDPERIRAALRGGTADRATRVARTAAARRVDPDPGHADPVTPEGPATWNSRATGWSDRDTAGWPESAGPVSAWDTTPNWGASVSQDSVPTNGNHHPTYSGSVFDTAVTESFSPDVASVSEEDPVPAWLADSEVAASAEAERLWPGPEDTEPARWSVDEQLVPPVTAESELGFAEDAESAGAAGYARSAGFAQDLESTGAAGFAGAAGSAQDAGLAGYGGGVESAQDAGSTWFAGEVGSAQDVGLAGYGGAVGSAQDAGLAGYGGAVGSAQDAGLADYGGAVGSAQDVGPAGFAGAVGSLQDAELAGYGGADGSAQDVGPAGFAGAVGSAQDAGVTGYAGAVGSAQAATQPVRPPTIVVVPDQSRRDRFFPLRLAAVMVIAAIIGSILVLVIR